MRWVERIASQQHCCFCFIFYQKLYHLRAPFFSPSFTHLCNVQTASKQNTIQFCLIEDRSCSSVLWCAWMGGQVFNYNSVCVNYLLVSYWYISWFFSCTTNGVLGIFIPLVWCSLAIFTYIRCIFAAWKIINLWFYRLLGEKWQN